MVFKNPPIYCHCWVEAYFFPPGHPGPSIGNRHNQVEESERPDAPEIGGWRSLVGSLVKVGCSMAGSFHDWSTNQPPGLMIRA